MAINSAPTNTIRPAALKQFAPAENDINRSSSNSSASLLARLTVIACKGRPDR